ncbi:unnamed protein product [Caenorhabditis auriculariae]|uniref:DUF281 domain-containing protein n=1 Tax=Caenorhabditis auriculariae TaxID=2777116 RepID=A0A8S1HE20_9PELO|nr:unnamed protein product [Caenorhabditis auriculariae]
MLFLAVNMSYLSVRVIVLNFSATTTTVPTTTTEPPNPCTNCPSVYQPSCLGGAVSDVCASFVDAGVSYVQALTGITTTCTLVMTCPIGSFVQYKVPIVGTILPWAGVVVSSCDESVGTWMLGVPPLTAEFADITCKFGTP